MTVPRISEHKYSLHLTFFVGDVDVVALAEQLPPKPYSLSNRGSRDRERDLPRTSLVVYRSSASNWGASLDEHWQEMQSRLKGYSSTFADLCALGRAIMLIVVDGSDQDYTAQVPNQLLAYCAELGIALEVEVLVEP